MDGLDLTEAWLKLNALEFRPQRARALLEAFDRDPSALFAASAADWRGRVPGLTDKHVSRLSAIQGRSFAPERETLARLCGRIIPYDDPCYPANLRPLPDAPPVLIARGALVTEDKFSIAIVGSRRAGQYGRTLAQRFARELAAHGLTVISGGARGVDTHAHQGALEGGGRTVAFLGSGVDVCYPTDNRALFDRIAGGGGAVVSEFPLGTRPEPWRFPARNRLISGMSLGVLVIESPADSGSLITAREAGDQGRDVFAIPGPVGDGRNSGCHRLIQDGAKLVETVDDILGELGVLSLRSPDSPAPVPNLPPEQRRILDMLALQPRHVDSLIAESGLTAPQVTGILTLLEMRGLARRVPGNAFVRVL
ncbi:MAG: DNA-protecting protein DprA [Armatimonadetes bacterium]|nr:DNA-protecting protein DprA [Armatimonadota bacterium]